MFYYEQVPCNVLIFAKEVIGLNVSFMINLDTGAQNVFGVFDSKGNN